MSLMYLIMADKQNIKHQVIKYIIILIIIYIYIRTHSTHMSFDTYIKL